LEKSRQFAQHHTTAALAAVQGLPGDKGFLIALIDSMARRGS